MFVQETRAIQAKAAAVELQGRQQQMREESLHQQVGELHNELLQLGEQLENSQQALSESQACVQVVEKALEVVEAGVSLKLEKLVCQKLVCAGMYAEVCASMPTCVSLKLEKFRKVGILAQSEQATGRD